MKILAIDTATEACSAALLWDDKVLERYVLAPREHSRLILPMIEEVLAEGGTSVRQMDALAFGRGPGSFTGVRIAAGITQGIAFAADLPVVPVSTLAALAQEVFDETDSHWAFPCIDARMGGVYWAIYGRGGDRRAELTAHEAVLPPDRILVPDSIRGIGTGSGWNTYADMLQDRLGDRVERLLMQRFPRAGMIAKLGALDFREGRSVLPEQALPVYLRDNVAKKPLRIQCP